MDSADADSFSKSNDDSKAGKVNDSSNRTLIMVFSLMVVVGLGNKVFNKLETIPMYNYPNFLNLFTTLVYIPVCFSYIIPMSICGKISLEQRRLPRLPFAIMGMLDATSGVIQTFAATYLPGPLLILLTQAAIPVSMILSKFILLARYTIYQYLGALIVCSGIITVLLPTLTGEGSPLWAGLLLLGTIPMALSSVYKELALGQMEIDPIYLNGWTALFQSIFAVALSVPSAYASAPPVPITDLPSNMLAGFKCYIGTNTVRECSEPSCTLDDCYPNAPIFVNGYLLFNQLYNLLIILLLKYGSANLFFMAMTLMVPLGNVAFTLPFVPGNAPLRNTDIIGLVVICLGLGFYRFGETLISLTSSCTLSNVSSICSSAPRELYARVSASAAATTHAADYFDRKAVHQPLLTDEEKDEAEATA